MLLSKPLIFQWDKGNSEKSLKKHNVTNREAEEIFFNKPLKIFTNIRHSQTEKRFEAFGVTSSARKLTIIFTLRSQKIRIISSRSQNKKERKEYEKKT